MNLPAARLGQRTATAFVATAARRDACATHLTHVRLRSYLNAVGLCAMYVGDLVTARDYLTLAIRHGRHSGDIPNQAIRLQNMAECLGLLGQPGPAREAAAEALTCAETAEHRVRARVSHAFLGWLTGMVGDATAADHHFFTADVMCLTDDPDRDHLYSFSGVLWAQWLGRTGRPGPAQGLTRRNADLSRKNGWNANLARCNQILGGLALAVGDTTTAGTHLTAAVTGFRDGDYLTELAEALPALATCAQATGDLDAAERYLAEAITIAAPRGLIPAQATTLAARARLRAVQVTASGNSDALAQGRDDADTARRLTIRHRLPWHELDALTALTAHADLDPDPLATVERLVEEKKAKGDGEGDIGAADPGR
jgi:tetratricopeptide (TPR) repeat protein